MQNYRTVHKNFKVEISETL